MNRRFSFYLATGSNSWARKRKRGPLSRGTSRPSSSKGPSDIRLVIRELPEEIRRLDDKPDP
jgi:hypothetical protein